MGTVEARLFRNFGLRLSLTAKFQYLQPSIKLLISVFAARILDHFVVFCAKLIFIMYE